MSRSDVERAVATSLPLQPRRERGVRTKAALTGPLVLISDDVQP